MRIKQLKEKRGSLMKEADAIIQAARVEKRSLSNAEDIRLGGIRGEILNVDSDIATEEREMRHLVETQNRSDFQIDTNGYSLIRALRGASIGRLDGYEAEVSQEIARRSGRAASGFYLPHSALIEQRAGMSVGGDSGAKGGNFVADEVRGFIDSLRPYLAVAKAGASIMGGLSSNISIPRHTAASTASWKGETAELDEATPDIEELSLTPKRVGAFTKYSKQLLAQSSLDIERFVKNDLLQAIAVALDAAAINGTGLLGQPTGILNTTGIGSVIGGTNGAAPDWSDLVSLVSQVANSNGDTGRSAFMFSTKVEAKLRNTVKVASTDSKMILEDGQASLVGRPWYASNNVPDNLTKGSSAGVCSAIIYGSWDSVVLASFGDAVDVVVDPFTLATSGQTRVVVQALADVGIRRAEQFAAMKDALAAP